MSNILPNHVDISVVIPIYNLEKYIDRCIISIRNQTFKNIEIILINDGSTDCSEDIIKVHSQEDSRVVYVKQSNSGVSSARNKGLEIASGSFVIFIDGDDWIDTEMLERMFFFAEKKQYDLSFCRFSTHNYESYDREVENYEVSPEIYLKNMIEGKVQRSACGVLFRLEFLKKNAMFFDTDMSYGEDMLFTIKTLLLTMQSVVVIPNKYYIVEERPGSTIRYMNHNQYDRVMLLAQKINEVFKEAKRRDEYDFTLQKYYYSDVLLSISHIINSQVKLTYKLKKINELKHSSHTKNVLNFRFKATFLERSKKNIIKYFPAILVYVVYKVYVLKRRL